MKRSVVVNFKLIPLSFILALSLFIILELASRQLLNLFGSSCFGGDLIKFDSDPLCRELSKYADPENAWLRIEFCGKYTRSAEEIIRGTPYDIIVFGDSTGTTGWAEKLAEKHKLRVANLTYKYHADSWGEALEKALDVQKKNTNKKSILLFTTIAERSGKDFVALKKIKEDDLNEDKGSRLKKASMARIREDLPSLKLSFYLMSKYFFRVEKIKLMGKEELFLNDDLKSIRGYEFPAAQYPLLKDAFLLMRDRIRNANAELIVVAFPTKAQQYQWIMSSDAGNNGAKRPNIAVLNRLAQGIGISFIDMETHLAPIARHIFETSQETLWFRDDTHMNWEGAKQSADILYEILKKHLEPSGPTD